MLDRLEEIATRLKRSFDRYFDAPLDAWRASAATASWCASRRARSSSPAGRPKPPATSSFPAALASSCGRGSTIVCLDLVYEDDFFGDHLSLITGQPTPLETVTLEEAEMLRIARADIDLLKASPMGQVLFLIAAEHSFVEKQQQQMDLLLKTPGQRYRDHRPWVVQRTAQRHVASYLGITTQSLSRIRRRLVTRR